MVVPKSPRGRRFSEKKYFFVRSGLNGALFKWRFTDPSGDVRAGPCLQGPFRVVLEFRNTHARRRLLSENITGDQRCLSDIGKDYWLHGMVHRRARELCLPLAARMCETLRSESEKNDAMNLNFMDRHNI
jgi:hypothetical protein